MDDRGALAMTLMLIAVYFAVVGFVVGQKVQQKTDARAQEMSQLRIRLELVETKLNHPELFTEDAHVFEETPEEASA